MYDKKNTLDVLVFSHNVGSSLRLTLYSTNRVGMAHESTHRSTQFHGFNSTIDVLAPWIDNRFQPWVYVAHSLPLNLCHDVYVAISYKTLVYLCLHTFPLMLLYTHVILYTPAHAHTYPFINTHYTNVYTHMYHQPSNHFILNSDTKKQKTSSSYRFHLPWWHCVDNMLRAKQNHV